MIKVKMMSDKNMLRRQIAVETKVVKEEDGNVLYFYKGRFYASLAEVLRANGAE